MWAVYIADMTKLQTEDPEVSDSFMQQNFSCQKSEIPGTAFSRDHGGEQMNKVLKTRGGITGITRNENSRWSFPPSPYSSVDIRGNSIHLKHSIKITTYHHFLTSSMTMVSHLNQMIMNNGKIYRLDEYSKMDVFFFTVC